MKHLTIIMLSFFAFNAFGQVIPKWSNNALPKTNLENDSIPKVIYITDDFHHNNKKSAIFINDQLVPSSIINHVSPANIAEINIFKKGIQFGGIYYESQVRITTKSDYLPKFVSLNKLKAKYTNLGQQHAFFSIDNKIVNADYDEYVIDENYVLSITVEKVDKVKGITHLNYIKVLTRTPENVEKSKQIRIRGSK